MNNKNQIEQTFALIDSITDKMWDMWLVSLGSMSWSQEQLETMAAKYLEQRKTAREEAVKVIEGLMTQVKNNQVQMQNMIQEAVKTALENSAIPNFDYLDLNKKLDELAKKIENL